MPVLQLLHIDKGCYNGRVWSTYVRMYVRTQFIVFTLVGDMLRTVTTCTYVCTYVVDECSFVPSWHLYYYRHLFCYSACTIVA